MYTAKLLGDSSNKELRRRIVTVEFSNGTHVFQKDFQFSLTETVEVMKRTVKQYLDELNTPIDSITDLTGTETQVVALRNKVKTDFKPAYL